MGEPRIRKLSDARRRPLDGSALALVRIAPLSTARALPVVVEPAVEGLDLAAWARAARADVDRLLSEHRALLFRGFAPVDTERFRAFVEALSGDERLPYTDRSTPRNTHGDRIYDATVHPADQRIRLHNEGTYWRRWPLRIYFACVRPAATGGQTPIADVHRVYERIAPAVRERFERTGVLYVRNFNHGFGLAWQEAWQTDDPAAVEAFCRANDIAWEWKPGGQLRTRQVRPAVRRHPRSGEPLWFNHAAFFHSSSLPDELRETLLSSLAPDELPYETFYGDGAPIAPETVRHVAAAYEAEKTVFDWQAGDVALYDNARVAHAREPYTGERLVLVAMADARTDADQEGHP
jgi:alpha-ketoglutarate-dependent taurine dioxygenase